MTPGGDWAGLGSLFAGSSGFEADPSANVNPISQSSALGQSMSSMGYSFDSPFEPIRSRRGSVCRLDGEDQMKGIDEILLAMEDGKEEVQRAMETVRVESGSPAETVRPQAPLCMRSTSTFQLPTPPTDTSSPTASLSSQKRKSMDDRNINANGSSEFSPSSLTSPYVPGSSIHSGSSVSVVSHSLPSVGINGGLHARQAPPTHVTMPTIPFVPPPPMCMFFDPKFKDLQKGKVGVWKGDLEVRGRGGGSFSILVVGDEATGDMW
jgi:hypothetical protein